MAIACRPFALVYRQLLRALSSKSRVVEDFCLPGRIIRLQAAVREAMVLLVP